MTVSAVRRVLRLVALGSLILAVAPSCSRAQVILRVNDTIYFRFGIVAQPTYEANQDPNGEGFSQNFYLRRILFIMSGDVAPGVSMFFMTNNGRLGDAGSTGAKNVNSGFLIQDAWAQWAVLGETAELQGGLFLVPAVRQVLTGIMSFLSLDLPTWTLQENGILGASAGRDTGFGVNGYLLGDHLSYRTGVFSGYRSGSSPQQEPLGPAAGSRNSPRIAGRLQYDFFESEKGYVYQGTNLGKKKVVAIGLVGDTQTGYKGYGWDAFLDWPFGKDALTVEGDYMHYDGHESFVALPRQSTVFINTGYYFDVPKVQPFLRYETLGYSAQVNQAKEQQRVGGGLNYYVAGQNFKITGYYERIIPKVKAATASIKNTNRFVLQLQADYY